MEDCMINPPEDFEDRPWGKCPGGCGADDPDDCQCDRRIIKTAFENPPIPIRCFDWSAWIDGREEWLVGRGETEAEAISDLQEQLEDEAWTEMLLAQTNALTDVYAAALQHSHTHGDAVDPETVEKLMITAPRRPAVMIAERWNGSEWTEHRLEWDGNMYAEVA
jgi:hypothetical protein